jgi:hypothetical protein
MAPNSTRTPKVPPAIRILKLQSGLFSMIRITESDVFPSITGVCTEEDWKESFIVVIL